MSEMREYIVIKLKEMGFDESKIERACNSTSCESLDQVMEWIITESEREFNPSSNNSSSTVASAAAATASGTSNPNQDSSSIGAKELDASDEAAAAAAAEIEEKRLKSPEEIEAAKKKLEDKIKQRRLVREEEERKLAIEKEKKRRETGSEISKYREQFETQEKIRIAQELRKDKLEREAHKKAVLEQIKKDREAMKRENQQTNQSTSPSTSGSTPSKMSNTGTATSSSSANSTECKLAIRLPDGSTLIQKFTPNEQLAAVRLFIQLNRKDLWTPDSATQPFKLQMPPNKAFTEEDMERTLLDLGLCPSARLFLTDLKRSM